MTTDRVQEKYSRDFNPGLCTNSCFSRSQGHPSLALLHMSSITYCRISSTVYTHKSLCFVLTLLTWFLFVFFSIQVDTYGTVQPHTLIRQHLDYNHWYDRAKLSLKEVHNCQYVACMNPTAGSFTINPRLQRHFAVFAISFPGLEALKTIYLSILNGHINAAGLPQTVLKNTEKLVDAAVAMNQKVRRGFIWPLKTCIRISDWNNRIIYDQGEALVRNNEILLA